MIYAAECSEHSITIIHSNLQLFSNIRVSRNSAGQQSSITSLMLKALCEHLFEKSDLYLNEMMIFLWDEFKVLATKSSISRALFSEDWSKKTIQQRAREHNADLQDFYFHSIADFHSYHLVFVDESECDKQIGFRWMGWSLLGMTSVQMSQFHRDQ